jgi:hypothetical protein
MSNHQKMRASAGSDLRFLLLHLHQSAFISGFGSRLRVDLGLEPAAQRMGQRQKDFGLQVLMAKA